MSDHRDPVRFYDSLSLTGIANSAIGTGIAIGNFGWSLVSIANMTRYVDATDTSQGNISRRLYTLIFDLQQRGILRGSAA